MSKEPNDDARAKFLEALNKKKQRGVSGTTGGPETGPKVAGGLASRGAHRRFPRKSGIA